MRTIIFQTETGFARMPLGLFREARYECRKALKERAEGFDFCTPIHRSSQAESDNSIDDKNEKNYLPARLNRKAKSFTAQFKEGAKA